MKIESIQQNMKKTVNNALHFENESTSRDFILGMNQYENVWKNGDHTWAVTKKKRKKM